MGHEMSRNTELTTEPFSSRIRTRSPEPFERNVRPKTTPPAISAERARRDATVAQRAAEAVAQDNVFSTTKREETAAPRLEDVLGDHAWRMDEDGDNALTHVVFDQPEHPMYERHLKRVLRDMCTTPFGAPLTSLPIPTLQRFSYKEAQAGQQKVCKAKKLVTKRWLEKILVHVGEALVATDQHDLLVDTDMGSCRLQLKAIPIVQVQDREPTAQGVTEAAKNTVPEPTAAKRDRRESADGRENEADLEDSGIGLQRQDDPAAEDSDDVVLNRAQLAKRNPEINKPAGTNTNNPRTPELAIERYRLFSHPTHRLVLRKLIDRSHGETCQTSTLKDMARELRALMATRQVVEEYLSWRHCGPDRWLVRFASKADAQSLVGMSIHVSGVSWILEPFKNERSQIFVCNEVPRDAPYNQLLKRISDTSRHFHDGQDTKFFAMKAYKRKYRLHACVYVILDRATDIESFTIDCTSPLRFTAWLGESKCQFCMEEHCMLDCDQFVPLQTCGGRPRPAAELRQRPDVVVR